MFGEKRNFDTQSSYEELERNETIDSFKNKLTEVVTNKWYMMEIGKYFTDPEIFESNMPTEDILKIIIRKLRENPEIKINELDDNEWEISVPWMLSNTDNSILSFSKNGVITIDFTTEVQTTIDEQPLKNLLELPSFKEEDEAINGVLNKIKNTTENVDKDFFNNLTDNEKSVTLDYQKEEIRKKLEEDYIVLLDKVIELKNVVSIVNQFQNTFGEDTLIKDILTEIPQELRATVFPHRKTSIKLLAKQLIELDEKRYKLHRKIEQFRFLFENGVTKEQTALDIYWQHEESNKQRYKIAEKIFAYPRISINDFSTQGFSIVFGMANNRHSFRSFEYHSLISENRSRHDDIKFVEELSKVINNKYPLIHPGNLYHIVGSFHNPLNAFELFISNQNLEAQSHELKITPEQLLKEIYTVIKEELTRIKETP